MIKINLVPADILAKAAEKQQKIQAAIVGSVLAVFIAGISVVHYMKAVQLEQELAFNKAELKKLEAIVEKVKQLEAQAAAVRKRLQVISDLDRLRPLYPVFMSDFVRSVPPGVWIRTMNCANMPNAQIKLAIAGEALRTEDIADWIRNLEQTGKFAGMELGPVSLVQGEAKSYGFTLALTYAAKL
jgi:Tfp pilus assembly protein PilN